MDLEIWVMNKVKSFLYRYSAVVFLFGLYLTYQGYEEYQLSGGSSSDPVDIELAVLENGGQLDSKYMRLSNIVAFYSRMTAVYLSKRFSREANENSDLDAVYYPIISEQRVSDFQEKMEALEERYGSIDYIPEDEWVGLNFSVIVKSHRFKKLKDVEQLKQVMYEEYTEGLVIGSTLEGLDSSVKDGFLEDFPNMDFDNVLILEEGRKPMGNQRLYKVLGGGIFLLLLGGFLFWRNQREELVEEV